MMNDKNPSYSAIKNNLLQGLSLCFELLSELLYATEKHTVKCLPVYWRGNVSDQPITQIQKKKKKTSTENNLYKLYNRFMSTGKSCFFNLMLHFWGGVCYSDAHNLKCI